MSIIEKQNPLNLQYRVCIVANCASPLGTIVCKTLLKANAFVFGVDTNMKHESLNAGLGMHFQFEQCDLADSGSAEKILEAVKEKFRLERLDILVNVVEKRQQTDWKGVKDLSKAVGEVMSREGQGCVVNVLGSGEDAEGINLAKQIAKEYKGVRCNAVVPSKADQDSSDQNSKQEYTEAISHMTEIMNKAKSKDAEHSPEKTQHYEIGNLTLFLVGDMAANINDSMVYLDGSSHAF